LEQAGFVVVRIAGSHHIMSKPGHPVAVSVPIHGNRAIPAGTLRSIIRQAGLTVDQFVLLLD
jgi:predicted RNA binding protein YcfA (HicA-like mRNA interferase family)